MNIYVGNISQLVTEDALKNLFAAFGEVSSVRIIKDKFSGQSRGFGFVDMMNKEEAEKAIAQLNGTELNGQRLRVNEARPVGSNPGPRRSGGGSRFGGPRSGGNGGGERRGGFGDRGGRGSYDR